jgi:hypothetical protein
MGTGAGDWECTNLLLQLPVPIFRCFSASVREAAIVAEMPTLVNQRECRGEKIWEIDINHGATRIRPMFTIRADP